MGRCEALGGAAVFSEAGTVRIILATGDESLHHFLTAHPGIEVVAQVHYREAMAEREEQLTADVALVSTRLPGKATLLETVFPLRRAGVRVVLIGPRLAAVELEELVLLGVYDLLLGEQPVHRITAALHKGANLAAALDHLEHPGLPARPVRQRVLSFLRAAATRPRPAAAVQVSSASHRGQNARDAAHVGGPAPIQNDTPAAAGTSRAGRTPELKWHGKPFLAIIEADLAGAESLAVRSVDLLERSGHLVGVLSLGRGNRLAALLGDPAPARRSAWQTQEDDLYHRDRGRIILSGPSRDHDLQPPWVEATLNRLTQQTDVVLADLGCRWAPRLFRPVLAQASHIWLVATATRSGWAAVEKRLEQAELSGWLDPRSMRVVGVAVTGAHEVAVPPSVRDLLAGLLPGSDGEPQIEQALVRLIYQELGVVR